MFFIILNEIDVFSDNSNIIYLKEKTSMFLQSDIFTAVTLKKSRSDFQKVVL